MTSILLLRSDVRFVEDFTSNRGSDEATALKINFIKIIVSKNLRENDPVVPLDDSSKANELNLQRQKTGC
jgi:hypothetical protein